MSPVDPALVRALHLATLGRDEAAREPASPHVAFQASTLGALLDGAYDGEVTLGEVVRHGDLGIGTLDALDGELVVVDGRCLQARADRTVAEPPPSARTPFAVVVPFRPQAERRLEGPLDHEALLAALDALIPAGAAMAAVRVDGVFERLRVRSVPRQHPPYRPLAEVVRDQVEWEMGGVEATVVGFRFPDAAAGIEVPGWHLHAVSADRASGGHVLESSLMSGRARVDGASALHVELPPGVALPGAPDAGARAAVDRIEHGHR